MKLTATFLTLFEIVQVLSSILDIGLDVAVCMDFLKKKQYEAFYASILVFMIAQTAYAFLFVAAFGKNLRTPTKKIKAFIVALPFAQFVPLFNWLESFHFKLIDDSLNYFHLEPSETTYVEGREPRLPLGREKDDVDNTDDNALWSFAHRKFKANMGFLIEAIVEAIPQAMIQTCAVVVYGDADLLIVISILMSVFVVASKGYMLSYSIDTSSFLFNAFCVVFDICGLFSTLVWTFAACSADSLLSPRPNKLYELWFYSCYVSIFLLSLGGFFLAWFANFDDHLKVRLKAIGRHHSAPNVSNVYFDLWVVRSLTWFVALIPASVMILSMKLTTIPFFLFHSIDPSHYSFPQIHKRTIYFINRAGPLEADARLYELNHLLKLLATNTYTKTFVKKASIPNNPLAMMNLREFISNLGKPVLIRQNQVSNFGAVNLEEVKPQLPNVARWEIRKENRAKKIEDDLNEFESRSLIWSFLLGRNLCKENNANHSSSWVRWNELKKDSLSLLIMRFWGTIFFFTSVFLGLLLIPFFLASSIFGILIPFIGPVHFLAIAGFQSVPFEAMLGILLSSAQVICLLILLYLYPSMSLFQSTIKDLFRISNHIDVLGDDAFYMVGLDMVLEEAYARYRDKLSRRRLREFLEQKTNQDCTKIMCRFLPSQIGG